MFSFVFAVCCLLQFILVAGSEVSPENLAGLADIRDLGDDYNCPGGNMYFVAHPIDALLYQSPDLYHDVHDFKCTTLVVLTAGDRGVKDKKFTDSLEQGLEASWSFMAGAPVNQTGWDGVNVVCGDALVTLRFAKESKGLLIIYLRFPDGGSDGAGHKETGQTSLKYLYQNKINKVTSIDAATTYDLDGLKNLIRILLEWKTPSVIRTLDDQTPIPEDGDFGAEHADHAVSARLVHEVIEENDVRGTVTSYGGNLIRKLDVQKQDGNVDFDLKADAYFEYAKFDKDACKDQKDCFKLSGLYPQDVPDDIKYTDQYLDRVHVL